MKPWLRRLHVILAVGGGFAGFAGTIQALFAAEHVNPLQRAAYAAFVGLYAYGIFAGLSLFEGRDWKHLLVFCWLQVPWISTPFIEYRFASGLQLAGAIIGDQLRGSVHLGAECEFNLALQDPWGIGVNVFALLMVVTLMKAKKSAAEVRVGGGGAGLEEAT